MSVFFRFSRSLIVTIFLFLPAFLCAQDRGTINGTVTDESGAVVPAARVTARHTGTGVSQTATTGADGLYNLLYLQVGTYTVTTEKAGFRKAEASNFLVEVNTVKRLDLVLQVGAIEQTVEVTSTAPLLETQGTNLGRIMAAQVIQDLPLTTGSGLMSTTSFIMLMPGVLGSDGNPRIAGGLELAKATGWTAPNPRASAATTRPSTLSASGRCRSSRSRPAPSPPNSGAPPTRWSTS